MVEGTTGKRKPNFFFYCGQTHSQVAKEEAKDTKGGWRRMK